MTAVRVGDVEIGAPGRPPLVIAELSANHNGQLERALATIDAIAAAGAGAVKFQTYTADSITIDHDGEGFLIEKGPWAGRRLHELYDDAATPYAWHAELFERARAHGMLAFSSPFDVEAVDFLEELDPPCYKIASPELIDLPLIRHAAATGKPLLMSTGMATLHEIAEAVDAARAAGDGGVVLLHCVSGYPTPVEEVNLRTIQHLADAFDVPVGLSDHTLGPAVSIAAAALGCAVIEKHVTLRRADGGVDSFFSLEPDELRELVSGVADAAAAVGGVRYGGAPSEAATRPFRRSLYAVVDIAAGEAFTPANVRSIRPGFGLPPRDLPNVLGRVAARPLRRGEPLAWDAVGPPA